MDLVLLKMVVTVLETLSDSPLKSSSSDWAMVTVVSSLTEFKYLKARTRELAKQHTIRSLANNREVQESMNFTNLLWVCTYTISYLHTSYQ